MMNNIQPSLQGPESWILHWKQIMKIKNHLYTLIGQYRKVVSLLSCNIVRKIQTQKNISLFWADPHIPARKIPSENLLRISVCVLVTILFCASVHGDELKHFVISVHQPVKDGTGYPLNSRLCVPLDKFRDINKNS